MSVKPLTCLTVANWQLEAIDIFVLTDRAQRSEGTFTVAAKAVRHCARVVPARRRFNSNANKHAILSLQVVQRVDVHHLRVLVNMQTGGGTGNAPDHCRRQKGGQPRGQISPGA